jgi:putative protease
MDVPEGKPLSKTCGFSKTELLQMAKDYAPKAVEVNIEEHEDFFVLILNWQYQLKSHGIVAYKTTVEKEDATFLEKIREKTKKELHQHISGFLESIINHAAEEPHFQELLEKKYKDTNLIYKVPKWCEIKHQTGVERTNLEWFYMKKVMESIPSLRLMWEKFVTKKIQHEKQGEIIEYLHGAIERFKQLLFAYDRLDDILTHSASGADTWFLVNFHVWDFISLVKSLGDNLAWILNFYCAMKLNPKKIDLLGTGFKHILKTKKIWLFKTIYENSVYGNFEGLKDFRDIVQHRHALHVMRVMFGFNGAEKVMIPINPETGLLTDGLRQGNEAPRIRQYAEASSEESIAKYGLKQVVVWIGPGKPQFEEPVDFCKKYIETMVQIYENTCGRILLDETRDLVGNVVHYHSKIGVAVIKLEKDVKVNDTIMIEGQTTSLTQKAVSIEIEHEKVEEAKAGQLIGLKVDGKARENDKVYVIPQNKI